MKSLIILVVIIAVAVVIYFFIRRQTSQQKGIIRNTFPSGKKLPSDDCLLLLSKGQLQALSTNDTTWLEDYALFMKNKTVNQTEAAKWDDLLRRIDEVINGF